MSIELSECRYIVHVELNNGDCYSLGQNWRRTYCTKITFCPNPQPGVIIHFDDNSAHFVPEHNIKYVETKPEEAPANGIENQTNI